MSPALESTPSWFNLPLLILVGAGVALFTYFLLRRTGNSKCGKVPAAAWGIVALTACAGLAATLFDGGSWSPPAAMLPENGTPPTSLPETRHPHTDWKTETEDSHAQWKAYDQSLAQAEVLPNRPEEKSWVNNPSDLGNVGYSAPAIDGPSAMRQARRAVSDQILQRLAENYWLTAHEGRRGNLPLPPETLTGLARDIIDKNLDSLVVDKYEERLRRPLGPVYRAAVKVDVNATTLQALTDEFAEEIRRTQSIVHADRRDLVATSISAVALALVILLLYSFLNAGTKGYFVWPLRLISIAVLAAIYAGWFYLKGWF